MIRSLPAIIIGALLVVAPATLNAACRVMFEVRVPVGTPPGSMVWISGDRAELGDWNGAGIALAAAGEQRFVGGVDLPEGITIAFKVTRGSWDNVEKATDGAERANRAANTRCSDTIRVSVASWRDQGVSPAPVRVHTMTGTFRAYPKFPSSFVPARDVWLWLPPGYDSSATKRYPVVYFLDGQNVFDGATSFIPGAEWRVDETADRLIRSGQVPAFIAVGVANGSARMDEYTQDLDARHGGGASGRHQRFLLEELVPFLDAHYRTRTDARGTAIVGSSLAGLAALDIGLAHPERFGLIASVSPSVWWADRAVLNRVRAGKGAGLRIWLDVGDSEQPGAEGARVVADAQALRDALVTRGYREGRDLRFTVAALAQHNERAWAVRVEPMLRFLLARP
ncbi:MAG: alpha/beta hydrolase-fold protein [Candidatus Eisenbacteria bacterium]